MSRHSVNVKSNSNNLLFVFSSRRTPRGRFTFQKLLKKFPATTIFLNDYENQWYTSDIVDGEYLSWHSLISAYINNYSNGLSNIYFIGEGMGAHAALKFGAIFNARRIIAFNPEVTLGMKGSRSHNDLKEQAAEHDLRTIAFPEETQSIIISNNGNFFDYYSASEIKHHHANSKVYVLNNFKGDLLEQLRRDTDFQSLIFNMLLKGADAELSSIPRGKLFNSRTVQLIYDAVYSGEYNRDEFVKTLERIVQIAPDWAFTQHLYGLSLDESGFKTAALEHYTRSITLASYQGKSLIKLAEILLSMKRYEEALVHLEPFCRKNNSLKCEELLIQAYKELQLYDAARSEIVRFSENVADKKNAQKLLAMID